MSPPHSCWMRSQPLSGVSLKGAATGMISVAVQRLKSTRDLVRWKVEVTRATFVQPCSVIILPIVVASPAVVAGLGVTQITS